MKKFTQPEIDQMCKIANEIVEVSRKHSSQYVINAMINILLQNSMHLTEENFIDEMLCHFRRMKEVTERVKNANTKSD